MEIVMGAIIGIGLSAACGFRIFVPLLGMSIANKAGHLSLSEGFEWIGSSPALIAFATATLLEICAFLVPMVDNLMDAAATPTAVVAGIIVPASQTADVSPLLKWSLAVIGGGGIATFVQLSTVVARVASTGGTAGLGNFVVATIELLAAAFVTLLAIIAPVVCLVVVAIGCVVIFKCVARVSRTRRALRAVP